MSATEAQLSPLSPNLSTSTDAPASPVRAGKAVVWTGRVLSGLAVLFLAFDGIFKLFITPEAVAGNQDLGWTIDSMFGIGVLQLVLLVVYLVPRTSVLGAILWVGYLGGAVATHVRIDNPLFSHVLFPTYIAALLWAGLWLRDPRIRTVFPFIR